MSEFISNPYPTITVIGGGTTGETAAGFHAAIEAGLVPGIEGANINTIVTSADNGGASAYFLGRDRLCAPGDFRRTGSALSQSPRAAALSEHRFDAYATPVTVIDSGSELLEVLADAGTTIAPDRGREITDNAAMLSYDVMRRNDELTGMNLGNLVVAALMKEHRSKGNGLNIQTALDEFSALMVTRGRIITDSLVPHDIVMQDGKTLVFGQSAIDAHTITSENPNDVRLWALAREPFDGVPANPAALEAIAESDIVVTSPGSLYGSIIAPLLVEGMPKAMQRAQKNGQKFIILANLAKDQKKSATMDAVSYVETIEHFAGRESDLLVGNSNTAALGEDTALVVDRRYLAAKKGLKVVTTDLVAVTNATYDPNNPLRETRSKVKSNPKKTAAVALNPVIEPELELVG
jgi:uncharacterized cofD-like protein